MSDRKKVMNYLDHETKVKFGDGLLQHSQEWQWLIEIIEERFEIEVINSWKEYLVKSSSTRKVFEYFVKILEICDKSWIFSKKEFEEIWEIAKFYIGSIDTDECMEKISNSQCRLFFWCIWITKLENADNGSNYLHDTRLLNQKNYFEVINCDSLLDAKTELIDYASTISISDMSIPLKCLNDNLDKIEYSCNTEFLVHYEEKFLNYNAFSFQHINGEGCQTWQETYLLDMLRISFEKRDVLPIFSDINGCIPDISMWKQNDFERLKKYFNHRIANFVIETVAYVKFNIEPSKETKTLHCKLLVEALNSDKNFFDITSSSSYRVLSYLFCDKLMKDCNKEKDYIELIKKIQEWENALWIKKLKENSFPISKYQRTIVSEFLINKYKTIDDVSSASELVEYLRDKNITGKITTEYLRKVTDKFKKYADEDGKLVLVAYYEYMVFLINVNQTNSHVDKRYVQKIMIALQKSWQKNVHKKQCENIHAFSYEQEIKKEELEKFSRISLVNPIIFAKNCTPSSEEELLAIMREISENPLLHLCKGFILSPIFPVERGKIIYERHDIDTIFLNYVKELANQKGYKLLNQFDAEIFMSGIHQQYKMKTQFALTLFVKEEELYNTVKKETDIELLPYANTTSLALLTQLFPVLEIKIRELVTLFGFFPFKKKMDEFMQYNDPSSLLRELLMTLFDEQHSFENVPDLIYVYNIMYNGNSCNVRNECIHGRDYLSGDRFKFAFRATLFAIHMIEFRIKTIKENVSDLIKIGCG